VWVEASRVWGHGAHKNPFGDEWLRFEPDSPVTRPLRETAAMSVSESRVANRSPVESRHDRLIDPFDAGFCVAGFYALDDGAVIELVWYYDE